MHRFAKIALFLCLLQAAGSVSFSQLRNNSPYVENRINVEHTWFVLYDSNEAGFGWASEWTEETARMQADKTALLQWHFKDGSTAYTQQGKLIGDIGMFLPYLLTDESEKLKSIHGDPVQPLTLSNYPVKIELWMGATGGQAGFKPEILVDAVCLSEESIEYGYAYYFHDCAYSE
ncbi:MAG: hypothetical protein JW793_11680 [Acidobacteria bacterium]|nr:hypothetical protein [Acidobacteriota bacterium]